MANDCPHRDVLGTRKPDGSTTYHCVNCNADLGTIRTGAGPDGWALWSIGLLFAVFIAFAAAALIRWIL